MNESLIYIIILIVIYLVRFFLKKGEEPVSHEPHDTFEPQERPSGPRRPSTFEELLEELGRKDYDVEETEVKEYQPVYETLEDPYFQHQPDRDAEARSVYENSVSQAKKFKTLDEQVSIVKSDLGIEKILKEEKPVVVSRYMRMLRNPQGLKDAVIMAEILNRKYD